MVQRRGNLFGEGQGSGDDRSGGGVGSLLKRRREELQQGIEDVSRQLRIRSVYIQAIEEGRFHELPGNAYAVGFVRAYANYLGLDGESIVGDYRDELARRSRQNDLVWPSEGSESRFPGGAILVVCVLLGLVIYGGWYYANQSGGTGIKLIDQVPEYIKKATGVGQVANQAAPGNAVTGAAPTQANAANAPSPAISAPSEAQASSPQVSSSETSNTLAGAQPAPIPPSAASAAVPPANVLIAPTTQNAAPATTVPPAVVATPTTNEPGAVALGQGSPAAGSEGNAPAAPSTAAPSPPASSTDLPGAAAENGAAPAAPANTNEQVAALPPPPAAKVVIRANRDSWIEIRDQNDAVLLQKVLRQGESFNVPDQKGLVMTTGNAGGIVIELEGKPLQSIGSLGVVKRGIKLDPAALANGSAFNSDGD